MMVPVLAGCLLYAAGGGAEVHFTDCSLDPEGTLLDARFVNVDSDAEEELVLALRLESGERELRIYQPTPEGTIRPEPDRTIPVLRDVVAWTFCDVRTEAGPELTFLTPRGAHAMSLTKKGLRGNLARWARQQLVFRVPDTRRLDYWPWLVDRDPLDWLILPGMDGMTARASIDSGESRAIIRVLGAVELDASVEDGNELEVSGGGVRLQFKEAAIENLLLPLGDDPGPVFLADSGGYRAPGLGDVDGDGREDVVMLGPSELIVYESAGDPEVPRILPLPQYLKDDEVQYVLTLRDLDGDGKSDLLGRTREDAEESLGDGKHTVLILLNRDGQLLPETPTQVLRFSATQLRLHITDINADGIPDLFTRAVSMPSLATLVTGLKFNLTSELHFGKRRGGFERKPAFEETQTFDEDTIANAIAYRVLTEDCSGDGIADLVAVDLSGRIEIRRLERDSGFFTGETWAIEKDPWKRFESRGSIRALHVDDWNGDGIGDILSYDDDRLALYLSRGTGGSR